jgi:hypothetical protein
MSLPEVTPRAPAGCMAKSRAPTCLLRFSRSRPRLLRLTPHLPMDTARRDGSCDDPSDRAVQAVLPDAMCSSTVIRSAMGG